MKALQNLTGTKNLVANVTVALFLSLIVVGVLALGFQIIFNTGAINNASF